MIINSVKGKRLDKKGKVSIEHFMIPLYMYLQRPSNVNIAERSHANHSIC